MHFVYGIQSGRTGRVYIGQSEDIEARLLMHNARRVISTREDVPWFVLKTESFPTQSAARWQERRLKRSRGTRLKWLRP